MENILDSLIRHGAMVLFCIVFVEQMGLPLPSPPFLLAAGALAARGQMNGTFALTMAVLASILADSIWFYLGWKRGGGILKLLCKISLEPDSCVRRTENIFVRQGVRGIVTAKFLPGVGTVFPPLAGMFKMKYGRFLVFDALGALLYLGSFVVLGVLFNNQLEDLVKALSRLGLGVGVFLGAVVAAYVAFKFGQRYWFLRKMRMARITPEELRQKQDAGEALWIVDLRSLAAVESDPFLIPGARHLFVDEVDRWHSEVPRDRDVILYCSCPNEASAARAALILHRRGITRVRPLLGGIDAWREHNFPLAKLEIRETLVEVKNNE